MTKPSYRMLKWTFFAAFAASLGTACVVSSGDGDDTDIDDGGSSGKTSSGAGKSGGGTGGKGGSGGTGAGTGGSSAGSTSDGGEPMGGTPSTYTAGLCDSELGTMTPSDLPSCTPTDKDEQNACLKCMKASCCEEWQGCYGSEPTTACGWGEKSADDLGQFDCIQQCFTAQFDGTQDEADLLTECEGICLNQCADKDGGFATDGTNALLGCTRDNCIDECYPAME